MWHRNLVTMSFTEPNAPVSAIPLPTLVMCPEIKTHVTKLDLKSAIDSPFNLTDTEMSRVEALSHVCRDMGDSFNFSDKFSGDSIYHTIMDVAPTFNDTVVVCKWNGDRRVPCSKFIAPVFTNEGLCFAFNALNSHEIYTDEMAPEMMAPNTNRNVSYWNLEMGYEIEAGGMEYPVRASNPNGFFSILLSTNIRNRQPQCNGFVQGFKLSLNIPGEAADLPLYGYQALLSEICRIMIKPTLTTTSEGLRKYEPNERGCFFSNERSLRFFKTYTQHNCEFECLANFTVTHCGEKSAQICGSASVKCYQESKWIFFDEDHRYEFAKAFRRTCNCLPSCTSIEYNPSIERIKTDQNAEMGKLLTKVIILFDGRFVTKLKRIEFYTYTDFLAICGGLLGLFLGISALSIIELIYFFTLRLFWRIQRLRSENRVVPFKNAARSNVSIDIPNA